MVKLVAMRFLNIQQLEITQYTQLLKAHHVLEAKVFPRPFFPIAPFSILSQAGFWPHKQKRISNVSSNTLN